ncbi:hypothetical protein [Yersinia enterocolitica]|uniref:hypothetical protein n=1 Tax=Yersinia enterocolitica TaxID=630 RepID=UPI0005DE4576|nr:hypothetical protein [Yersinia enterocolitica]CNF83415.1 Uncharacterised protein [Yersinia enterocolitica]HDL6967034.1 hypothetical protein [Yersinia enterocolitica]HDL6975121.1 hypothetical protein [Yersinia enterocolitica]HDL6996421.1 hypothetical protein [Yersinia enterocolitica]HDL7095408.1 hypothetical protein [Yersinia enterocolitica]
MSIIIQFSDETEAVIISWFGAMPPFPEQFPNIGEVEASDPRWKVFYDMMNPYFPGMPEPTSPTVIITEDLK